MIKRIMQFAMAVLSVLICACTETEPEVVPVSSITLDPTSVSLVEGQTATISATIFPDNATNPKVIWSSTDISIATVEKGVVSAISEGTATISATSEDGGKMANCSVIVSSLNTDKGESKLVIKVDNITESSCKVSISSNSSEKYFSYAIDAPYWNEYGSDAIWDATVSVFTKKKTFESLLDSGNCSYTLSGLNSGTVYVIFAAFCDETGVRSGSLYYYSFRAKSEGQKENSISIYPVNSDDITQTSVTIKAEIETRNDNIVIERGFKYHRGKEDEWTSLKVSSTENLYKRTISSLPPYALYIIKAYAIIENTITGERQEIETDSINVMTKKGPASIDLFEISHLSSTSVIVHFHVNSYGGEADHGGYIISTVPNPTIHTLNEIDYHQISAYNDVFGSKTRNLTPDTQYYVRAYYINDEYESYTDQISIKTYPVPEGAIDLGLPSGVLWSDHNLGGKNPEDSGGYYAWGETSEKASYTARTSAAYGKTSTFCMSSYPSVLLPEHDAAMALWGNGWRMPTINEIIELYSKCKKRYIRKQTGSGRTVEGVEYTGPNGNSIFLPAAGHKQGSSLVPLVTGYWSADDYNSSMAYCMLMDLAPGSETGLPCYYGFQIRPVT